MGRIHNRSNPYIQGTAVPCDKYTLLTSTYYYIKRYIATHLPSVYSTNLDDNGAFVMRKCPAPNRRFSHGHHTGMTTRLHASRDRNIPMTFYLRIWPVVVALRAWRSICGRLFGSMEAGFTYKYFLFGAL